MFAFYWLTTCTIVASFQFHVRAFLPPVAYSSGLKSHQFHREVQNHRSIVYLGDDIPLVTSENSRQRALLKQDMYQLAASYDRGFSATARARKEASDIIQNLSDLNPTVDASRGIDGSTYNQDDVPLKAIWRMIWTTAFDVVSLGASPFAAPSAIYQVITDPPIATNVIDFIPRAQTFLPSSITPSSLLRAEVSTRASLRSGKPNRVGLVFEGVKLQPIELLGQQVDNLPALSIDLTWQQNILDQIISYVPGLGNNRQSSDDDTDKPGYFDVEYLDDELLIIRQQAPGGVFALVKVDSYDS